MDYIHTVEEYQSLQECYLENPHILKDTEKIEEMIYKVLKRRWENRKED